MYKNMNVTWTFHVKPVEHLPQAAMPGAGSTNGMFLSTNSAAVLCTGAMHLQRQDHTALAQQQL
jgi:hypothetical protein